MKDKRGLIPGCILVLLWAGLVVLSIITGRRTDTVTLTYADVNPIEGTIVGEMALAFKEKTEELSGGTVIIDIQANGVLGSDDQINVGLPMRGLCYGEEGFRNFFFKDEINDISDIKGRKICVYPQIP